MWFYRELREAAVGPSARWPAAPRIPYRLCEAYKGVMCVDGRLRGLGRRPISGTWRVGGYAAGLPVWIPENLEPPEHLEYLEPPENPRTPTLEPRP